MHRGNKLPPPDVVGPLAGLTVVGGALYGTTQLGGTTGNGMVYKITTSGVEQVVYNFQGPPGDGAQPLLGRLSKLGPGNLLWGTTTYGGTSNKGIVFTVTTSGVETVIHNFSGGDGDSPADGTLIKVGGVIYGTTEFGGTNNGNFYQIGANNAFSVLYNFQGGFADGCGPQAGLTQSRPNVMYGTTVACGAHSYEGVVFKITTGGTERVLLRFRGHRGQSPVGELLKVGNAFYGTTSEIHGTVYKITPSGTMTVLHNFHGPDGDHPMAGLTYVGGLLYGTTPGGGTNNAGTVFSITPSGTFSVLYNFQGGADGARPYAGLTYLQGLLYGTTQMGGLTGNGTVYSITTSGVKTVLHSF